MKRCSKCGRSDVEFHKHSGAKDGLQSECKGCQRDMFNERREADPERYRAAVTRSRARVAAVHGHRQESDRRKRLARKKVYYAVSRGHIVRPDRCSRCGRSCKPQAHHADYTQPLSVEWLCAKCHTAERN